MDMLSKIGDKRLRELMDLAKLLAVMGVRNNTDLENLHSGVSPTSKAGDYSDVKVVSPDREIEWTRLSRINDEEMRSLMLSVERALLTTLCVYELLGEEDRKVLLDENMANRSYDLQDFNAQHKKS